MDPKRVDLYNYEHKSLRRQLFAVTVLAGATDFTAEDEVRQLQETLERVIRQLQRHNSREDEFIHPLLIDKLPGVSRALEAEHEKADALLKDLENQFGRVKEADGNPDTQAKLGQVFYRTLNQFLSEYLGHLDEEEQTMLLLWEICTHAELVAVLNAYNASRRLDESLEDLGLMLPALSLPERAAVFSGLKSEVSDEVFESACRVAQEALSPADWSALQEQLRN